MKIIYTVLHTATNTLLYHIKKTLCIDSQKINFPHNYIILLLIGIYFVIDDCSVVVHSLSPWK